MFFGEDGDCTKKVCRVEEVKKKKNINIKKYAIVDSW